jgi:hypothetical protein
VASSRKRATAKTAASKSRAGARARGRSATKTSPSARNGTSSKSAPRRGGPKRTRQADTARVGVGPTNPMAETVAVTAGVAAGAIQAGGDIAAAGVDIAKSAARALAAMTTGVTPEDSSEGGGAGKGRGRRRKGA